MDTLTIGILVAALILIGLLVVGLLVFNRSRHNSTNLITPAPRTGLDYIPGVGDDATEPRDTPRKAVESITVDLGGTPIQASDALSGDLADLGASDQAIWEIEVPESSVGRLGRLRARLARSNNVFGKGLLSILSGGSLDDQAWDDVEATLLSADLGVAASSELIGNLKMRIAAGNDSSPEAMKAALTQELTALIDPSMDRSLAHNKGDRPVVIMVVGVNGTGKTTTVGKLSRVLVSENKTVVMAAADTFRAAAADQLQTWGDKVGAAVVRGPAGGDPASVAFEAVQIGQDSDVDVVVVDTAGRLHTKTGLMDELGKVKRVIEKQSPVDEVLLVLDATTGQNGLTQAKVFSEVVDVTGIVLTKLDGTAKGGIVIAVQRELGVPVKLVGLGEGPDDLAPFEVNEFVAALLA
jgi:fused signal recognition particle receptor